MPPPTTSMRLGIDFSCNAPVESTMRGSVGQKRQFHGLAAGGNDRLGELDRFLAARRDDFEMMRIEEGADAGHDLDLAGLRHAGKAARQLLDHAILERRAACRGRSAALQRKFHGQADA